MASTNTYTTHGSTRYTNGYVPQDVQTLYAQWMACDAAETFARDLYHASSGEAAIPCLTIYTNAVKRANAAFDRYYAAAYR